MINNEKLLARIRDYGIKLFKFCGCHTSRSREYDFIMNNISHSKATILDMGSVGSLLPLKLAEKGHIVYVVDTREYHEKHPNITSVKKDINSVDFSENDLDEITCVSVLEHIGMSAYGDPAYKAGDEMTIKKFTHILKSSGRLLITMPFAGEYKVLPWNDTYEKIYNYNSITTLFKNWKLIKEEYYIPTSPKKWIKSNREDAEKIHNVKIMPLQPREEYFNIINSSDISIVSLDKRMTTPALPGKFINLLGVKQPILANVPAINDVAKIVTSSNCGIVTEPGNIDQIVNAIIKLKGDSKFREEYGQRGYQFLEREMNIEKNVGIYEQIFENILNSNDK